MRKSLLLIPIIMAIGSIFLLLFAFHVQANELVGEENPSLILGEGQNKAYIAIQLGEDDNLIREVKFDGVITGLEALQQTGFEVITKDYGWGIAVCSINGVGCPAENCFCDSEFWNYTRWVTETWQDPGASASTITITNGAVEGWRWGEWGTGTLPPAPQLVSAANATKWIALQQNSVLGCYPGSGSCSMSSSTESLLTIGANNFNALNWRYYAGSVPLHRYVWGNSSGYSDNGVAEAGKFASGFAAANGLCWSPITIKPMEYYDPMIGSYSEHSGFHIWGMIGTISLGEPLPSASIDFLLSKQMPDGGWEWNNGFTSDTNTTALAIQTLVSANVPVTSTQITNALSFLKASQNEDGGFTYDPDSPYGTDSETNSTAYAIQAIYSVGQDPITGTWVTDNSDPIKFLLSMQLDGGSFQWSDKYANPNLLATQQAIPALLAESLPYDMHSIEECPAAFLTKLIKFISNSE